MPRRRDVLGVVAQAGVRKRPREEAHDGQAGGERPKSSRRQSA